VLGTVLVGAAQPFFQCTPPLLSTTWFAASEWATSTAVALNFNQIGIATAFLVGGAMAVDPAGLARY
jgi:FLVCR family feline leukemia virus subgroup C receptor-related protein